MQAFISMVCAKSWVSVSCVLLASTMYHSLNNAYTGPLTAILTSARAFVKEVATQLVIAESALVKTNPVSFIMAMNEVLHSMC